MTVHGIAGALFAAAVLAGGPVAAADPEGVPLYTSEDLDRMFGPVPSGPSEPVDKTRPEDWRWVEQFLDRQYARVDADRRHDLERRALESSLRPEAPAWEGYTGPVAWGLGYPASTWWNNVWCRYSASLYGGYRTPYAAHRNPYARATGEGSRPGERGSMSRGGHGNGRAPRSK